MKKGKLLYEGKSKRLYDTDDPELGILEFAERLPASPAHQQISAKLLQILESKGVGTHFEKSVSEREMLVKRMKMIPVEVTIRNRAAGGMVKQFGIEEGTGLACPVYELHYKSDPVADSLINEYHLLALKIATEDELKVMRERSLQVNNILRPFFEERGLELIDFQLEFGRSRGKILLGDEISPATCRLWEIKTGKKFDKDRFQAELFGEAEAVYQRVLK